MSQQADSSDIISTTTTCAKKQHPRKKFKAILETDRAHQQQQQTQGANPARPPTTLDLINQFFIRKTTNYMTQTNKQYSFKMRPHKHQVSSSRRFPLPTRWMHLLEGRLAASRCAPPFRSVRLIDTLEASCEGGSRGLIPRHKS